MKFIVGKDRKQAYIFPVSLEEAIADDNEVRLIDLFVDILKLEDFGFKVHFPETGRPAYHPRDLLKLFIYGYMNKIRSSRDLEKETKRNLEVMWLLNSLSPDHNTISNFRRDNPKAIKKVFRSTVQIAKHFDLIGGKLIAGDSVKLRAQNSKKNNYNQKKIDRHVEYIDRKLDEYKNQLSEADQDKKEAIEKEIDKHLQRKDNYKKLEKELLESGEIQISASDPESRQMIIRNNITEVAYNTQVTTDSKHCIPIDYKVTNENDSKAMGNMLQRAKSILRTNNFTALYDKGYHTGSEIHTAHELGIETMVAVPDIPRSSHAPDPKYNVENFIYSPEDDTYTCPEGKLLRSNNTWYQGKNYLFRQFKTNACKNCRVRSLCTKSEINGKIVQRSEFSASLEKNRRNVENQPDTYKKRQSIAEHPFGTIKRQWGFDHVMTKKGMEKASSDIGFILTAYNLKRIINIVGFAKLAELWGKLLDFLKFQLKLTTNPSVSIQKPLKLLNQIFLYIIPDRIQILKLAPKFI